jgi:hypothetical protein
MGGKWLKPLSDIAPGLKRARNHIQSRHGQRKRINFYAVI